MKKTKFFLFITLTLGALGTTWSSQCSADAGKKGLEIAKALVAQDDGFKDVKAVMKMVLKDRHGKESTREIINQTLEVPGDGDKSLIRFDTPKTVKGTKFLSFTHKSGPDDQWLFLPRIKRVKRIASDNKSGPFMGSEFAYEDIASQEVEKYTYKYLRDEACGKEQCHVMEWDPVDPKSGYSKMLVWVVKGENKMRIAQTQYFDVKNTHFKTLQFKGYKQYKGRFWRADLMHMVNHSTGKETELRWSDYQFQTGLTKRDFDKNSLKK